MYIQAARHIDTLFNFDIHAQHLAIFIMEFLRPFSD